MPGPVLHAAHAAPICTLGALLTAIDLKRTLPYRHAVKRLFLSVPAILILWITCSAGAPAEDPQKSRSEQVVKEGGGPSYSAFNARAKIIAVAKDGILCTGSMQPAKEPASPIQSHRFKIFGSFPDAVEGGSWEGPVFPAGRYEFAVRGGSFQTVPAWIAFRTLEVQKHVPPANSEGQIRPPCNLVWGAPEIMLRGLFRDAKAKVVSTEKDGSKELAVKGLVAMPSVTQAIFEVQKSGLCRVTIEYSRPDWDEGKYLAYVNQMKAAVTIRFGEGTKVDSSGEDASVLESYTWPKSATFLSIKCIKASDTEPQKILATYGMKD